MSVIIPSSYLNESSILKMENMVAQKMKRHVYNFDNLPTKAIIGIDNNIFKSHIKIFSKKLKGIRGVHCRTDKYVLCSGFGSGAPAVITLLEELRILGVQEFIFIGLAGILSEEINTGDVFFVDGTLSGCGAVPYYFKDTLVSPYNREQLSQWAANLNLPSVKCFSTDSPFRETSSLIKMVQGEGCRLIEMECAAVYAFAQYYKLNAACFLTAADRVNASGWQPPAENIDLTSIQRKLVDKIIKLW